MEGVRNCKMITLKKRNFEGEWSHFLCLSPKFLCRRMSDLQRNFSETFSSIFSPQFSAFFSLCLLLHSRGIKHYVYVLNLVIVKKKKKGGETFMQLKMSQGRYTMWTASAAMRSVWVWRKGYKAERSREDGATAESRLLRTVDRGVKSTGVFSEQWINRVHSV